MNWSSGSVKKPRTGVEPRTGGHLQPAHRASKFVPETTYSFTNLSATLATDCHTHQGNRVPELCPVQGRRLPGLRPVQGHLIPELRPAQGRPAPVLNLVQGHPRPKLHSVQGHHRHRHFCNQVSPASFADCSINGKQYQGIGVNKRRKKSSATIRPCRLTMPRPDSTLVPFLLPEQVNFFVLFMSIPTCSCVVSQRLTIAMIIYLSNP